MLLEIYYYCVSLNIPFTVEMSMCIDRLIPEKEVEVNKEQDNKKKFEKVKKAVSIFNSLLAN